MAEVGLSGVAAGALSGYSVMTIVIALTVVYVVVHYMFASLTADTTVLLPVLLTVAIAVLEMAVKLISLLFRYTLGLMGIISPCATGPGLIYYRQRLCEPQRVLDSGIKLRLHLSSSATSNRGLLYLCDYLN
jgi:di/tricarboxylate transporter